MTRDQALLIHRDIFEIMAASCAQHFRSPLSLTVLDLENMQDMYDAITGTIDYLYIDSLNEYFFKAGANNKEIIDSLKEFSLHSINFLNDMAMMAHEIISEVIYDAQLDPDHLILLVIAENLDYTKEFYWFDVSRSENNLQ